MAMNREQVNASAIDDDMAWLGRVAEIRLQAFLGETASGDLERAAPMPTIGDESDSDYHRLVKDFNYAERLVFALAMMMHVRPQLLDALLVSGARNGNIYTEFGGIAHARHRGFVPTGETALFLLDAQSSEARFRLAELFSDDHIFAVDEILYLAEVEKGLPATSGELLLYPGVLQQVTTGLRYRPEYGEDFPALELTSPRQWSDKVFNPGTERQLDEVRNWILHANDMRREWGMTALVKPGYRCLFYGPPGTGKTLTCALLGNETGRRVFRIDLSGLVSKYIGETIKNLEKVFRQAGDEILFFDEADAIFGKRTKVSDAHDRFANQEVSYLLQRIEEFEGVVILASNLRDNIDDAFMRRFQSIVYFPLPDTAERKKIWEISFPRIKPENESICRELAEKYEISGGNITNAAQAASLLAYSRIAQAKTELKALESAGGDCDDAITALRETIDNPCILESELTQAVRREYAKEGKSIPRQRNYSPAP